jgi:hypothetical protein
MTGFILMASLLLPLAQTVPDSSWFSEPHFSYTPRVFHHPDRVLFNTRPFDLELFIDFPRDSLETVSLFYKTDSLPRYLEIPMDIRAPRFLFQYDPVNHPAGSITYFFTVTTKDGALYAVPVDSAGNLNPITKYLLDPQEYFKRRSELRQ